MVAQFAASGILTALRTAIGGAASVGRAGLVGAGTIASKLIPGKTELPEQQTVTTTVEKTDDKQDNEKLINDATEAVAETRRLNEEAQSSLEPGLNLFQQIKGILESIKERIRREMNEIADDLALGGCMSAESADKIGIKYAQSAGVIEGLARAERAILDILDEIKEQEKLDT